MAPFQYIERPSPFSTKGGKTLPVFAVTPAHVETGTLEPLALDWAKKAGFKAESGSVLLIPTADGHVGGALYLFLRGTRAASQGAYFTRPPRALIESLDLMFQGQSLPPKAEPAWEQGVLL